MTNSGTTIANGQRISEADLRDNYWKVNVDLVPFRNVLIDLGPNFVKDPILRARWSKEYPTTGNCYVVSEWLYWYHQKFTRHRALKEKTAEEFLKQNKIDPYNEMGNISYLDPMYLEVPGSPGFHWFLNYTHYHGGTYIWDLTVDQFANYDLVNYSKAKRKMFIPPGDHLGPSKRAIELAVATGYAEDYWKTEEYQKACRVSWTLS